MDTCTWTSKDRRWEVSFTGSTMNIAAYDEDFHAKDDSEPDPIIDDTIHAEDVARVKFERIADTAGHFPDDYSTIDLLCRHPKYGEWEYTWRIRDMDAETLARLLEGMDAFLAVPESSHVSEEQLADLQRFARDARKKADDVHRVEERRAGRKNFLSALVERYQLDQLDRGGLASFIGAGSVAVIIVAVVFVIAMYVILGLSFPEAVEGEALWYELLMISFAIVACVLGHHFYQKARRFEMRLAGQKLFLCSDGLMLVIDYTTNLDDEFAHNPDIPSSSALREAREERMTCWYTGDSVEPPRITEISSYEVKGTHIVLHGWFHESGFDYHSSNFIVTGREEDSIDIWRTISKEDERRLLGMLDEMVVLDSSDADRPW